MVILFQVFRFLINFCFRVFLAIFLLCLTSVSDLFSQGQYTRFSHLTVDDGLSSNRIWCIHRDSKDYLWMSTDLGLDKWDSYQVKKYRYSEKLPGSVSSDNILCIYEDIEKRMWFGSMKGINLYRPEKDNFEVFKNDPTDSTSLNTDYVNTIFEDKSGNLWVLTDGNCLNKWIPGTHSFVRYKFEDKKYGLSGRPTRMMANDADGFIWIVPIDRGIIRFEPSTGKFTKFDDPKIDFGNYCFKSLYIDNQGKIWIASDGSGLFSYEPSADRFEQFGSNGDGKGSNKSNILDIMSEDDRFLLLAVDQGGINRFDKKNRTFEYFIFDNSNQDGLNNNGIWCFHKDREGILWIGTSGGGINFISPKTAKFKLFKHSNNPQSLSYDFTGCFYEDRQGLIWIGTDGGGVNVYDPSTGNFNVFDHNASDPNSISGNVIRCISEDKNGQIWIGTWDSGLNRYERKTGKFAHFMPLKKDSSGISGRTIWNFRFDHNDNLWLAIYSVGIDLLDINKGVIKRFRTNKDDPHALSSLQSYYIYEDAEENIWICTENGLDLYDKKTNSFKVFNFPDNALGAFLRDKDGNLWVGSNIKGIYYCNPDGTIIRTFDITNGLPNNRIQALIEDNAGNIWVSTGEGISRIDRKDRSIKNYSKEDGLQGNQFFQQSFLKTRRGELYFGGYNGFNSFYPDSLKDNDYIPPVYITDFQIFNKPVEYDSPNTQFPTHISEAKEIKLNWKQSVFSFSFVAINYTHPQKNHYAYKMEGFDKEWINTSSSRRYVTYTNLDPGKYTFRVKASNNDGVWNENGVSLRIIILPPWWKTWAFRLIAIFVAIYLLSVIYILRIRSLKKQKILLEKTVEIKTAQLNELNASKDKFFSIIAHDLKNPFNTIIGFSEMLKEEINAENNLRTREFAKVINSSAIQTYRLLENLLEWANSQHGKIPFKPQPINLNEFFKEEFLILNEIASAKNIELKTSFADDLIILADKNMIKTILRNLISNAIKFTHKNGKVEVSSMFSNGEVEITISDTGIGMTPETMAKLFRIDANLSTSGTENEKGTGLGLFLCKEFVEKHGGRIWVESEYGKGSQFKFVLPSV